MEMCRTLFGFEGDRITADNWERLYDSAAARDAAAAAVPAEWWKLAGSLR